MINLISGNVFSDDATTIENWGCCHSEDCRSIPEYLNCYLITPRAVRAHAILI